MNLHSSSLSVIALVFALAGCSGSSTSSSYRIVGSDGNAATGSVGDALRLSVVQVLTDGKTSPLSTDATVTWSGPPTVEALAEGSDPQESILPQPGAEPAAMWVKNPEHLSDAELAGVLYIIDRGSQATPSIDVTATVTGSDSNTTITENIPLAAFPVGDVSRGQAVYAANCGMCHGTNAEGGMAPGLDDEPDNVAGDPDWTPQLLGIVARSNMDDMGVALDTSMPKWLTRVAANGQLLTTQDFADIYAYLKTQHGLTTP